MNEKIKEEVAEETTVSKEDYEKLKEIERNKTIAIKQERDKRKQEQKELEELRKYKQGLEDKERKKKGEYEKLLEEKEGLINELTEKAKLYDNYIQTKTEKLEKTKEELESKLGKTLDEYRDIYDDLNLEKQVKFLSKISIEKPDFDTRTKEVSKEIKTDDFEKAKKGGDLMYLISNAKKLD